MKPDKIKGVVCEACGEFTRMEEKDIETRFVCSECGEVYDDEQEAKDCCKE